MAIRVLSLSESKSENKSRKWKLALYYRPIYHPINKSAAARMTRCDYLCIRYHQVFPGRQPTNQPSPLGSNSAGMLLKVKHKLADENFHSRSNFTSQQDSVYRLFTSDDWLAAPANDSHHLIRAKPFCLFGKVINSLNHQFSTLALAIFHQRARQPGEKSFLVYFLNTSGCIISSELFGKIIFTVKTYFHVVGKVYCIWNNKK